MKRVLCILENGFEEIETITPIDILRRADSEVILAAISPGEVTGRSGVKLIPDALFTEVSSQSFDALFLPGGSAVMRLRSNLDIIPVILRFHTADKIIAAICAAPLLLHDAGVLEGKKFTSHFTTTAELPKNTGERLVLDGKLLTSRGAGTALDFALAFVAVLHSQAIADDIATAIMA